MTSSVALYEALTSAPDERTRARVIAEAFERLEERYPHLPDLATQGHLRESELRLQKEIEQVRAELRESELRLRKEIEQVRAELRESELRLQKEIEQVRGELRETELRLRKEIAQVKVDLLKWLVPLMFAQVAAIAALVKLL
jgi:chromosome segregation ATPase